MKYELTREGSDEVTICKNKNDLILMMSIMGGFFVNEVKK